MLKATIAGLIITVLFLPTIVMADISSDNQAQLGKINNTANQIAEFDFKPLKISVTAPTKKEVLWLTAKRAHEYLRVQNISPIFVQCLDCNSFVTDSEISLVRMWVNEFVLYDTDTKALTLSVELSDKQLRQLALFNMWPLYI